MAKAKIEFSDAAAGTSMRVEMHYQTAEKPGHMRFSFANSKSGFGASPITCDLGFEETYDVRRVLSGESDRTNGGNPLDLGGGVSFAAKRNDGGTVSFAALEKTEIGRKSIVVTISECEAEGLKLAIGHAAFFMAFIKGVDA